MRKSELSAEQLQHRAYVLDFLRKQDWEVCSQTEYDFYEQDMWSRSDGEMTYTNASGLRMEVSYQAEFAYLYWSVFAREKLLITLYFEEKLAEILQKITGCQSVISVHNVVEQVLEVTAEVPRKYVLNGHVHNELTAVLLRQLLGFPEERMTEKPVENFPSPSSGNASASLRPS
jgi:hypothetical protein